MNERFAAFSFVDRISRRTLQHIEGQYTVPAHATRFPASLMAEAVGQLAAWSAMSSHDFSLRPVAGLAARTRYLQAACPGQTLTLEAEIVRCDAEAIAYGGRASIGGRCALELDDCLGPMLPMEEFDEAQAVRRDFEMLCGPGAAAGRFGGVPVPDLEPTEHLPGRRLVATLRVPGRDEAPFFGDHFPRRAVYPGTLLLDALGRLAVTVADEARAERGAGEWVPRIVTDVKIRTFTPPGARLELSAELIDVDTHCARLKLAARGDGRSVASAKIEVGAAPEVTT
jgi:3-hydroxymyristoyl/3-hydroxydecanoyl-(acyl carrier protein) dehydratase